MYKEKNLKKFWIFFLSSNLLDILTVIYVYIENRLNGQKQALDTDDISQRWYL